MLALIIYFIGAAVLVVADQFTKLWAINHLQKIGTMPIVGDYLRFTYAGNTGAAFSILEGQHLLLIAVPLVMSLICIYFLVTRKLHSVIGDISLMLIIAGGIGNLIDRIFRGFVVDFIDLAKIHFAIFNVADSCVTVGAVLLVIYVLVHEGVFGRGSRHSELFTKRRRY